MAGASAMVGTVVLLEEREDKSKPWKELVVRPPVLVSRACSALTLCVAAEWRSGALNTANAPSCLREETPAAPSAAS